MSQYYVDENAPHLGGYIPGGDPATYYSEMWRWLVEKYGVRSVVDVGCGEGHALKFFASVGVDNLLGIDGIPQPESPHLIATHDYTIGPFIRQQLVMDEETQVMGSEPIQYDLCWSCEFVEHIEEQFIPNFLATFKQAKLVLMTHAVPGQDGWHHVNCRDAEYWKGVMAAIGYKYDEILTVATKELARQNENAINHYVRAGLAFTKHG